MEKVVYTIVDSPRPPPEIATHLREKVVPDLLSSGIVSVVVNLPDSTEVVRERSAARITPAFERFGCAVEVWLDSVDERGRVEAALAPLGGALWGYLVTESVVQARPCDAADGERRPGIAQYTMHKKPEDVAEADFYREWHEVHSRLSFAMHPRRVGYVRNAVARRLTPAAPDYRSIVTEHFAELEDFTDDARYFGEPAAMKPIVEHLPKFCSFDEMLGGPTGEYRYSR